MMAFSSSTKHRDIARKLQNCEMPLSLYRSHRLEKSYPYVRSLLKSDHDSVTDICEVDHQVPSNHFSNSPKVVAKENHGGENYNADNKFVVSKRNLNLGITTMPTARAVVKPKRKENRGISTMPIARAVMKEPNRKVNFSTLRAANPKRDLDITKCFRRNIVVWTNRVVTTVGPGRKEREYQLALDELLQKEGFDVAVEQTLKFKRLGENIQRRADLIVSIPGESQRVLIECKAKAKLDSKDKEQVQFYRHHFGIETCYLINFRPADNKPRVIAISEESKPK
jgi:GxxExxY protein